MGGHVNVDHIQLSERPNGLNFQVDLNISDGFLTAVSKPVDEDIRFYYP